MAIETDRNRSIRTAREALKLAVEFEDETGAAKARADLSAIGVDEAGDDLTDE